MTCSSDLKWRPERTPSASTRSIGSGRPTTRLRRHRNAIEAGVDPAALVEAINQAHADRAAAQAELDSLTDQPVVDVKELDNLVDSLGDIGAAIESGEPLDQMNLYRAFGIQMRFLPSENVVVVQSEPRVVDARVRGGIRALTTRIDLGLPGA